MRFLLIAALVHTHPVCTAPPPPFCGNGILTSGSAVMDVMVPCPRNQKWHPPKWRHGHHHHEREL